MDCSKLKVQHLNLVKLASIRKDWLEEIESDAEQSTDILSSHLSHIESSGYFGDPLTRVRESTYVGIFQAETKRCVAISHIIHDRMGGKPQVKIMDIYCHPNMDALDNAQYIASYAKILEEVVLDMIARTSTDNFGRTKIYARTDSAQEAFDHLKAALKEDDLKDIGLSVSSEGRRWLVFSGRISSNSKDDISQI